MKKLSLPAVSLLSVMFLLVACSADDLSDVRQQSPVAITAQSSSQDDNIYSGSTARIASTIACGAYEIALESVTQVGSNYEWVWSVRNINPGNGNGGTVQDLSHWGMQFGSCFNWSSVVGAAYSGDGAAWTSFTPLFQVDPSQNCLTTPVLKFDFGTVGGARSYYKLVVNQNYMFGLTAGYYKSGNRTGCCTYNFVGIGCTGLNEEK